MVVHARKADGLFAKGKLGFALTEKVETGKPLLLLTHTKTLFEDFAWEAVIEMPEQCSATIS